MNREGGNLGGDSVRASREKLGDADGFEARLRRPHGSAKSSAYVSAKVIFFFSIFVCLKRDSLSNLRSNQTSSADDADVVLVINDLILSFQGS